jgi:hypothetical protein
VVRDPVCALQHALYRAAKADPGRRIKPIRILPIKPNEGVRDAPCVPTLTGTRP